MSYKNKEDANRYRKEWGRRNPEKAKRIWAISNGKKSRALAYIRSIKESFEKILRDNNLKQCKKCFKVNPLDCFSLKKICKDGLRNHCKSCVAATVHTWYENNKAKHKSLVYKWIDDKRQNAPNEYKDFIFRQHNVRRERHYNNGESTYISKNLRQSVFEKYNNICLCCGAMDNLTLDHIVPVSCGGKTIFDNLQLLCATCNSRKNNKTIDYRGVIHG